MTCLTSPRHSYTYLSPRLYVATVSTNSYSAPQRALNRRLVVSSFPHTSQILVFPHTCLQQTHVFILPQNWPKRRSPNSVHRIYLKAAQVLTCLQQTVFPYFPKIGPKKALPTLSTESASRKHKSSFVE
jgi:hypothetical protein